MKNFLKLLVALLLVLMVNLANAQIKVHDDDILVLAHYPLHGMKAFTCIARDGQHSVQV